MYIFQNHHRHSFYTNARISDSTTANEEYAQRAVDLGHGIISSVEHGWQGRYIEAYENAKKYNLKFLFGTEAYWVKDRLEEDRTNAHICLLAKNENGRQALNDILSEANISGFYYRPRVDIELLMSLPANDVWVTSACIAFWQYGNDTEEIIRKFQNHFGKNFFLEVQYHRTEKQSNLNKEIIDLSRAYNIPIIMGCDSHYITEDKAWERDDFIKSRGIDYADEDGWYMDYPNGDIAYQRFVDQGVLTPRQIETAMDNTNTFLNVETYDNPMFNKEIKMPTLYPELSQEDKNNLYEKLVWKQWEKEKANVPEDKHDLYVDEIKKEIDTVKITRHADYFLSDYQMIQRGIEKGGMITQTGRGSAVSFYTNKLLGFTKIDRISSPVKMYPERFMSATRILESKSLADLDMNLGNPEVFAEAQKEIFGEDHAYPMIAYGTLKAKSAWKMYAKAKEVDFDLANQVSEQIEQYENALKHADEDEEEEEISIYDYVDEKYHDILKDSESYLGIVSDLKVHPCAHLIYQGNIRKEIGLIKTKSKTSNKEFLCTVMDGKWAEDYKFLKNDLLKVTVVETIHRVYQRIGLNPHDVNQLIDITKDDKSTWDIYAKGYTMGINQVEQNGTKHRMMQYKAQNISELCAFVAAIRPGFKSMYKTFANRESFSYGIPTFDQLIQTEEMPNSFMLYQEMAMAALNFAGIPMSECYDVVKNIAKKRAEKVLKYQEIFLKGFADKIKETESKTQEESDEIAHMVWKIIGDSVRYSFNASHAFSVAVDSLYGAYLKSHYPLQFYEVFLNILDAKGNQKDRMGNVMAEAKEGFKIQFAPFKFGQDNRKFTLDENTNSISRTLSSVKGFGTSVADILYDVKDKKYDSFVDLLIDLTDNTALGNAKIETLITLNYFSEFGRNQKLATIFQEFTKGKNRYNTKHTEKTKQSRIPLLYDIENNTEDIALPIKEQIKYETELLGTPMTTYPVQNGTSYIIDLDLKNSPKATVYGLSTGKIVDVKIQEKHYKKLPFEKGDIVRFLNIKRKQKVKFVGKNAKGKPQFEPIVGEYDLWCDHDGYNNPMYVILKL
jgi:DNA polymerase III alpha subunit